MITSYFCHEERDQLPQQSVQAPEYTSYLVERLKNQRSLFLERLEHGYGGGSRSHQKAAKKATFVPYRVDQEDPRVPPSRLLAAQDRAYLALSLATPCPSPTSL